MKWIEVFHGNRTEAIEPSNFESETFQSDPESDPKCNVMYVVEVAQRFSREISIT